MITERELNIEEAYSRLTKMHQHLGLHSKIELSKNNSLVATCHLYDKTYNEVSCGAGKGEHCELGALAESLEHYFVDKSAPAVIGSDQILQSIAPFDDWLLKSIPPDCRLPSFNFQALNSDHEIVIPAILIAPSSKNVDAIEKTAAGFLSKYATNSGTALGCTENEALLHAINEAIERHALSMYYLSLCGLASPLKLYQPSNSFLEETFSHDTELFRCAKKLEIYMTHDFYDVPFCIAVSRDKKEGSLSSLGSGSSINPSIAMYRAVTEQIHQADVANRHFCMHWPERCSSCASTFACTASPWQGSKLMSSSVAYDSALKMRTSYRAHCPARCCSSMRMNRLKSRDGLSDLA